MAEIAETGEVLLEKYQVQELLGEGGMGLVYRARHLHLKQDVALKFLRPSLVERPEAVERFLREARAMAQLRSEHVARVMDVAKLESGVPYLVMEFLHGSDLHTLLDQGPLSIEDAIDYVVQACEAVGEAHMLGIIHRDLKPSNLFLTRRRDHSALIKVLDFGISKIPLDEGGELGPIVTATNSVVGSPRYMSPEQIRSARNVDSRADIWSLGIVLHELVTANHPFPAETPWDTMAQILSRPPILLRAQRADAPAELEAVVRRCLEKDRDGRFADVASLVAALAAVPPAQAQNIAERARPTPDPESRALAVSEGTASSLSPPSGSTLTDANWGASSTRHAWTRGRLLAGAGVLAVAGIATALIAVNSGGSKEDRAAALGSRSEAATPSTPPKGEAPAAPKAPEAAAVAEAPEPNSLDRGTATIDTSSAPLPIIAEAPAVPTPPAPTPVVSPPARDTAQPAKAPVVSSARPATKPALAASAKKRVPAAATPPSSTAAKPKSKVRSAEDILNQRVYAPAKK
jgi:eukaryotic-like serine/threonine-protein kinase